MAVTLRPYSPDNFETLYAIDQACYPRGIAYSRSMLREFLSLPGADCLVARLGEARESAVAGFIIGESAGAEARIITIDVVEAHRRAGVGTALLQAVEERLAGRGARRIELETATANAAGVAFWERHGYRKTGVLRGYYLGRFDAWKMRKSIAASEAKRLSKETDPSSLRSSE
jgi:[ribosomal protein S18]-alanine N-acetyltransferase